MFPMEFDHNLLETLPVPDPESINNVLRILKTVASGRVFPYFRNRRGTDPPLIARTTERLVIQRLEAPENRVGITSLVSKKDQGWVIQIHERVFDFMAFVLPGDPESRLGEGQTRKGKSSH